ncbi:hypothetical protein CC80DRAFT_595310 [Byssothecium circinans]|uniref:Lysine-specific metallo-endopeptidase domain-containing protein n=1 Tax=Byssothecium circinans TaxID=147558 RepID=A0A6A5TQD7_9PLEO|nr:hypothetical protein CC80DRAFT_595310 [Byssothecium circinans]
MNEVRKMGTEGSGRLNDDANENMAYSFKTIFKLEKSDETAKQKVLTAFNTIAAMTKTDGWEASDVRFYCDDDNMEGENARWKRAPGNANKRKPFERQVWADKPNQMSRRIGSKGCQDENEDGEKFTLAQTYQIRVDPDPLKDTHNPERETITLCDDGLNFDGGIEKLLSDFKEDDKKVVLLPFLNFDALLSVTVFHELCHLTKVINAPGTKPGGAAELYGWEQVLASTAAEAIDSADAFAWLGMLALTETRNMRLARPDSQDETEKKRAKQDGGGLVWIDPSKAPQRKAKRAPGMSGAYFNQLTNLRIGGKRMVKF